MLKKIFLIFALIIFTASSVEAADENNLPFDSLASTYVEGGREFLNLIRMKDNGELLFMVAARKVQGIALVPYSRSVYDFYLNQDQTGSYPPLIFGMMFPDEQRPQIDDNLGDWQGNLHLLPVYALFEVKDGQIICDKPFYSARGLNPTHYHGTIRNTDHEKLIEIFMTHMPRLHEIIAAQNISLP